MKSYSRAPHLAALFLSLIAVSSARADWLSNYTVAVSNSPSGPFGPTANLWTATPLSIDLAAETGLPGLLFPGNAYVPLGLLTATLGRSESPVFPQVPFSFQVTPQGKKPFVLSGQLNILDNGNINFGPPITVTVGKQSFNITYAAIQRLIPASEVPGEPSASIGQYDIYALVPLNELVRTPEPSGLMLAGIGAIAIFARRRRMN
jgi:hypothetical protein